MISFLNNWPERLDSPTLKDEPCTSVEGVRESETEVGQDGQLGAVERARLAVRSAELHLELVQQRCVDGGWCFHDLYDMEQAAIRLDEARDLLRQVEQGRA